MLISTTLEHVLVELVCSVRRHQRSQGVLKKEREMKMESHHGSLQSLALVLEGLQSPWRRVMVPWWRAVVLLAPGGLRQLCVSNRGVFSSL